MDMKPSHLPRLNGEVRDKIFTRSESGQAKTLHEVADLVR